MGRQRSPARIVPDRVESGAAPNRLVLGAARSLLDMDALSLTDVAARYSGGPGGPLALAGVNLRVAVGERVLLVGPNGAGKSTLIRVCAGLMRPSHGTVHVCGAPAGQARHLLGVVGHATLLYDELTALENLVLYGELYGVPEARARGLAMIVGVGLEAQRDVEVGRLSRGQQQRVAIARAVVHDPPLLLLDEPDTGLDVAAFDLLTRLIRAGKHSLLMTTHDFAAGLALCTRVVVIAGGHVVEEHARGEVDQQSLTERVRTIVAAPRA
jgi:heme exporter protein A